MSCTRATFLLIFATATAFTSAALALQPAVEQELRGERSLEFA